MQLCYFFSAWLSDIAGTGELYIVAIVSGLADVNAITLNSLRLYGLGKLEIMEAVTAITLGTIANLVFKLGFIFFISNASLAKHCTLGMLAIITGLGGALFLVPSS